MRNILIVDDTSFWRETVGSLLRAQSYAVMTAADAAEAIALLQARGTDLIVLDLEVAHLPGISLLEQIHRESTWKDLPVIILTGDTQKEHVLLAKKFGAADYLLKSRFSPQELLERVQRRLGSSQTTNSAQASLQVPSREFDMPVSGPTELRLTPAASLEFDAPPELLTREKCLARAARAMSGRTLAGVVADVIASADSPTINLSDLATLVARDGMLSARVLQAANSAANVSAHAISTVTDAVRVIGCTNVRNIAATVGVFDAMPEPEKDGFSPIRTWQHSLVVARLCQRLALTQFKPLAYLAGLCHDLGGILFRTHFGGEYRQVLEAQKISGQPLHRIELQMLGATHGEISEEILRCLGLPENITRSINAFHHASRTNVIPTEPLARTLRMADFYASGILLASSEDATVAAFTQAECLETTGRLNPVRPDDLELREEIMALTIAYARVSPKVHRAANKPLFAREDVRLLVVRDSALSAFDPITAALDSMAQVTVAAQLPAGEELGDFQGLVVIARHTAVPSISLPEVQTLIAQSSLSTLFLVSRRPLRPFPAHVHITLAQWPIAILDLARFIARLQLAAV